MSEGKELPRVIVADLSFISLGLVLPAFSEVSGKETDLVVLIKPQFEVGRGRTKEGVVTDPAQRFDAVTDVMWSAHDCGFVIAGLERSPVVGSHGNQEYLLWLKRANGSTPTEWRDRVVEVTR